MIIQIKNTLKNSIIYSIGNISTKIIGFILLPLYTSHLTISDYGALALLESVSQILISFFGFGLYNAFIRFYWDKNYQNDQKSIFFSLLILLGLISFTVFWVVYFNLEYFSYLIFDNAKFKYILTLVAIISGFEIVSILFRSLLRVQERAGAYIITNFIKLFSNLSLTIFLVAYEHRNVQGIFEAQVIGNIIYFLSISPIILKEIRFKFQYKILKEMLRYSLPLMFSIISGLVLAQTDKFMLEKIHHISDTGIYSLGLKIANSVKIFIVMSVQLALSPIIYKMINNLEAKRFYSKIMTYFTYGVIPFSLFVSIFGNEIISLLSSNSDYYDSANIIPIISISIIFGMLKDTSQIGLNIMKLTQIVARVTIFIAILNLILNYLLIPEWNTYGASIATLLCQIIGFILILINAQKKYYIPYEYKKIILMIALAVIIFGFSLLLNNITFLFRVIVKFFLILNFPIILYFLNFYDKVELENFKKTLKYLKRYKVLFKK
jgi:O-antigen/teichoic acid export membrane protein